MGGFSLWHWLIVLVIVVLVFGTKRLKNVGQDLGEAMRGFKKGLDGDEQARKAGDERARKAGDEASPPGDAAVTPTEGMRSSDDERNPPAPR